VVSSMGEFGSLSAQYHIGRVRLTDTALHSSHPGFVARLYTVGTTFPNHTLDDTVSIDNVSLSQIISDSIQSVIHELFSAINQLLNDSEPQLIPGGILQVSEIQPTFPSAKSPSSSSEWMWSWETRFSRFSWDVQDNKVKSAGLDKLQAKQEDRCTASHVRRDFRGYQRSPESVGEADSTHSHGDRLHLCLVTRLALVEYMNPKSSTLGSANNRTLLFPGASLRQRA
jgi:hypothetical protein